MSRVAEYRKIMYNRLYIPTVNTIGIRKGASYITRTPKPCIRFAPYIYGYKPCIYENLQRQNEWFFRQSTPFPCDSSSLFDG